jgi:hypothetical protein
MIRLKTAGEFTVGQAGVRLYGGEEAVGEEADSCLQQ